MKGLKYTAKGEWGWVGALFFLNRRKKAWGNPYNSMFLTVPPGEKTNYLL